MTNQNATATALSSFHESRIYAEGWKTGRGWSKSSKNPYTSEPERSRWLEGYTQAAA